MLSRLETLAVLVAALLMVSAGLTWQFGALGLIGAGVLVLLVAAFMSADYERPKRQGERR